jgi:ribosomal protein S18 acetylase RimI-like enzyme
MSSVLQLCRRLESRPESPQDVSFFVRSYRDESDIEPWLELRHQAFARQRIGVRQWNRDDFLAEFVNRWWWQPQRMWLAESNGLQQSGNLSETLPASNKPQLIGAVTLSMRGEQHSDHIKPAVHWLIVHPRWRRRGIGKLLMAHLETAAWDAGFQEVWLETHTAWDAAVKFYRQLGYTEQRKENPS